MTTIIRSAPQLAATTPARRDHYVDFLRVASLGIVIIGHWLMAAVVWDNGHLSASNVLESTPGAAWLTWLFQIMPVFFVVGGFANAASWAGATRKGVPYGTWLASRLSRLVRPVLVFAVVWAAALLCLSMAGVGATSVGASSIAQPLWFLAVYVGIVAVAPVMVEAQHRWGWGVLFVLGAGVTVVDLARWPLAVPYIGWLNLALVWLFVHQLGLAWRGGAVTSWSRQRALAMGLAGLGAVVLLSQVGGYPRSMVGGLGEVRSNVFPPSLAMVALATWQFGLLLAVRPVFDRWLTRPRASTAVLAANGLAMTVYVWHMTALVLVAAIALPAGVLPQPPAGSVEWWALKPLWLTMPGIVLLALVGLFAPVELRAVAPQTHSRRRALTAALVTTVGIGLLARKGFAGGATPWEVPFMAISLLAAGWWMLRTDGSSDAGSVAPHATTHGRGVHAWCRGGVPRTGC
ncbi:MAG TPA: acyltransferase [Acidimicrobiales bacterium]